MTRFFFFFFFFLKRKKTHDLIYIIIHIHRERERERERERSETEGFDIHICQSFTRIKGWLPRRFLLFPAFSSFAMEWEESRKNKDN